MADSLYPYFIVPDIEALASERDPEMLQHIRRRIAANVGDPDALRALLGEASGDFHDFYGTLDLPVLSTAATIDSFIEKFGKAEALAEGVEGESESSQPLVPVTPPALDYAAMLEEEMEAIGRTASPEADATLGVIDTFLNSQSAPRVRPKKEPKEVEKPSLTEGFAKIMIKNGNYRRALQIITEISLNNPEKSIYFADQIRFLKKVISLESRQTC